MPFTHTRAQMRVGVAGRRDASIVLINSRRRKRKSSSVLLSMDALFSPSSTSTKVFLSSPIASSNKFMNVFCYIYIYIRWLNCCAHFRVSSKIDLISIESLGKFIDRCATRRKETSDRKKWRGETKCKGRREEGRTERRKEKERRSHARGWHGA